MKGKRNLQMSIHRSTNDFTKLAEMGAFQDGFNSIDHTQAEHLLAREEAAMTIDGGWALPELANTATPEVLEKLEVTVLPMIEGGRRKAEYYIRRSRNGLCIKQ